MQRIRLSQNLWLDEFVAPEIYSRFQGNSLIFVNPLLPKIVQTLRNKFGCVIINNWSRHGKVEAHQFLDFDESKKLEYFTQSGVRSPQCSIGATYSQHKFGNAADLKFTDATPKQVRKHIIKHYETIYRPLGLMAIEDNTNSWLHIDCRNSGSNKLFIINKTKSIMARMTKKQLSNQGKSIMRIAKQIQKASPRKKWTTCVKEAGKKWKNR